METVKVSPKFEIVLPKHVCETLNLKPGDELDLFFRDGSIHLQPRRTIKELRGAAKGMKWKDDYRDRSDRF